MGDLIYDVIVVGGGPGGTTAATLLALGGKNVVLLEKERFPRFHVGESLLPYNRRIFEELGVLPNLEAAISIRKHGAQFHWGDGTKSLRFAFRQGKFTKEHVALQVERSKFDQILLDHARRNGVKVWEECVVGRVKPNHDKVTVDFRGDGPSRSLSGRYLIDASGRANLTGNQEGLRRIHPHLKKAAIFGHFSGVRLDEGEAGGDTVIVRLNDKWFWLIPLSEDKASVGLVLDQTEMSRGRRSPEEIFREAAESSPPMRQRMANASVTGPWRTTADFSYYNRRLIGPRIMRVGDAAGFMDPIFSAGVYLAMWSGRLAARTLLQEPRSERRRQKFFGAYERKVHRAMAFYWEFVEAFYTPAFMDVFFSPSERLHLASAVNAVLAGELEMPWSLRWRLRLFFAIVRLQRRYPLVPRLEAEEPA